MAADAYHLDARLAASVLAPAVAVFILCLVSGGYYMFVWLALLSAGLACLALRRARFVGYGLLLGSFAVFVAAAVQYE
jgi:hypothetical protein